MLVLNQEVFDEIISGTSAEWVTSAQYNRVLGARLSLVVFARATDLSGTSPTITMYVDSSADNQYWSAVSILSESLVEGTVETTTPLAPNLAFRRLRIQLGGTNPKCRLRLRVTGRN